MSRAIPRRKIEEIITRWELTKLPLLLVEGPSDHRFFCLLQRENYCANELKALDVCPIDDIDINGSLVEKWGFSGTGAKQRAISLGKEIEQQGHTSGFRSVVDKDLDFHLNLNYCSEGVLYTDFACMEIYSWTPTAFSRLLKIYHCEEKIANDKSMNDLYTSISHACAEIAAIRIALLKNPDLDGTPHKSEKTLSLSNGRIFFNQQLYAEQCRPKKGMLPQFLQAIQSSKNNINKTNHLELINGHDLLWILTFALRELTKLPRRSIELEAVAAAFVANGVAHFQPKESPMFSALTNWLSTQQAIE